MNKIRISFLLTALVSALGAVPSAWGDTQPADTHFSLVKGKVKVVSGGGISRRVTVGDKAYPGETIQVAAQAQAQIVLFDGSTLDLSSNSKVTLGTLQQPSTTEKIISLKLALGKVFAQVRKLMTAKSSFEIEAGGVVCGVRGTAFSMDYNPDTNKMDLDVQEGKVAAMGAGVTLLFGAGQQGHFTDGHFTGGNVGSNNPNGKSGGKGGQTGGNSNGNGGNNSSSGNGGGANAGGSNGDSTGNAAGNPGPSNPTGGTTADNSGGNNPSGGGNTAGGNNTNITTASTVGGNPGGTNAGSTGDTTGTGGSGGSPPGTGTFQANACLNDLNTQINQNILINNDNSLSSAQQSVNIHLIVPGKEAAP